MCINACTQIYVYMRVHKHMHTKILIHNNPYIHTHINIHIHTHINKMHIAHMFMKFIEISKKEISTSRIVPSPPLNAPAPPEWGRNPNSRTIMG